MSGLWHMSYYSTLLIMLIFLQEIYLGKTSYTLYLETTHGFIVRDEGRNTYKGHVMLAGDTMTLSCSTKTMNQKLWFGDTFPVEATPDGRIIQVRDHTWLNTTIRNMTLPDAGKYSCNMEKMKVRVTNTKENPPNITKYSCTRYGDLKTVCSFITNARLYDIVDWSVLYSQSTNTSCSQREDDKGPCACDKLDSPVTQSGLQVLHCAINDPIDTREITFNITGANPFSNYSTGIPGIPLETSEQEWITAAPLEIKKDSVNETNKPYKLDETDPKGELITMQGALMVDKLSYTCNEKNFLGYAVKLNAQLNISCKLRLINNAQYNYTNVGNNKRFHQSVNRHWINTTINVVSFEDAGRHVCGNDAKMLRVVDPDKAVVVRVYKCMSSDFEDMVCTFETNALDRDFMDWHARYSDRDLEALCGNRLCQNVTCDKLRASVTNEGYDEITCILNHLKHNHTYDFTLTATNPFSEKKIHISQTLNLSIVIPESPMVIVLSKTASAIQLNVTAPQNFTAEHTLDYNVTDRKHNLSKIFSGRGTTATLSIEGLTQFTEYSFNVACQFSETVNRGAWSDSIEISTRTAESVPVVAPEKIVGGYYINPSTTECKDDENRRVTLYWKAIPEKVGYANGVITSYSLYKLDDDFNTLPTDAMNLSELMLDFRQHSHLVTTTKIDSASLCMGNSQTKIAIVPSNSAGMGVMAGCYVIPSSDQVIQIKPCDIQVTKSLQSVVMKWDTLPSSFYYTVYWCEYDKRTKGCQDEVLNWFDVGQQTFWNMTLTNSERRFKFGISAIVSGYSSSSGIVWSKCVNNPGEGLKPASIHVQVFYQTATVSVECPEQSELADYYTVKACLHHIKEETCSEHAAVLEKKILPCQEKTNLYLPGFSTNYSIWVISHAANQEVNSTIIQEHTGSRRMPLYEILLIVFFLLMVIVTVSCVSVWFYKQKRMAMVLKRPQVVIPSTCAAELENVSDGLSEYGDFTKDEDGCLLSDYLLADSAHPVGALVSRFRSEDDGSSSLLGDIGLPAADYREKILDHHFYDTSLNHYEEDADPFLDYQLIDTSLTGEKMGFVEKTGSAEKAGSEGDRQSNKALPDDYLHIATHEPELSISSQLFFVDSLSDTSNKVIDIARFLNSSSLSDISPSSYALTVNKNSENNISQSCNNHSSKSVSQNIEKIYVSLSTGNLDIACMQPKHEDQAERKCKEIWRVSASNSGGSSGYESSGGHEAELIRHSSPAAPADTLLHNIDQRGSVSTTPCLPGNPRSPKRYRSAEKVVIDISNMIEPCGASASDISCGSSKTSLGYFSRQNSDNTTYNTISDERADRREHASHT